ncbi:hypothetical protein FO519_006343 [Halicephalobus sp. NKZ332]|nr:hypothetical protein FO519_006343 [Halicephalobus sp. NKZ332]
MIASGCGGVDRFVKCNWDPEMLSLVNNRKPTKGAAFFCTYDGPGKATVFFTGNSFALRQLPAVKESLKGKYKKFYYAARPACLTFESFNDGYSKYWQCDEIRNKTVQFLKKFKPDFLVITQKMSDNSRFTKRVTMEQARNDSTTLKVAEYFKMFSPFVKKIFVIEPHMTVGYNPATKLAKAISLGNPIDKYFLSLSTVERQVNPGWFRILAAMENCPKCVPISIRGAYCKGDKCPVYEEKTKLSLFCDNAHVSPHGGEVMIPVLKPIFDNALTELGLN